MKYEFPHIDHISQVLPLIENKPEFIVAAKDGDYTVINYVVQMADTFPPVETHGGSAKMRAEATRAKAILRELRGLIFRTSTGKVIARRLHKFFNANERDETQINKIDFSEPHVILEKLDGSMITPVWTDAGLRWGTKMGVTEVALPVEAFVMNHPQYRQFAKYCQDTLVGSTPIFEWCSRKQAIVIDHPVDKLVLIAVRHNTTGVYANHQALKELGAMFDIPVVEAYEGNVENMQALLDYTRDLVGIEGFVVRFDSGHMIKVKAEDYVRKHKAKDMLCREKNVIEVLVNEKADDIKGFLDAKDLNRFNQFEADFWDGVKITARELRHKRDRAGYVLDRKTYAVEFVQKQDEKFQRFLYKMFDDMSDPEVLAMVKDAIANSCSTQTKVDEARWMFGCHWNEQKVEE